MMESKELDFSFPKIPYPIQVCFFISKLSKFKSEWLFFFFAKAKNINIFWNLESKANHVLKKLPYFLARFYERALSLFK